MFSLSRISMLVVAFVLGFAVSAGAFLGIGYHTLNTVTLNQIEEMSGGAVNFPTERVMGPNPEVDLPNISILALFNEAVELNLLDEKVTINFLVNRYDLILGAKFKRLLSKEAAEMPLKQLMTEEGEEAFFNTLYIGQIQGFECLGADGESATPTDDDAYWYDPKAEQEVSGLKEILSDYSVGDILSGRVSSNSLISDLTLAEVLEYTYDESSESWLDKNGTEVTGVMSVLAKYKVTEVGDKLKTIQIGEILGYTLKDGIWYEKDEEENEVAVHVFMNAISNRTIDNMSSLMSDLTIGDIIPEADRKGFISLIPADTKFNNISTVVNNIFNDTSMRTFVQKGVINFEDPNDKTNFLNSSFADCNIHQLLAAVAQLSSTTP